jgi:hypothetical protein
MWGVLYAHVGACTALPPSPSPTSNIPKKTVAYVLLLLLLHMFCRLRQKRLMM